MADGDVVIDRNFEVDAEEETRVELFAVEDSSRPGGYHYRFQYYSLDGEEIFRYDNAHDSDVGPHHRHDGCEVTGIEIEGAPSPRCPLQEGGQPDRCPKILTLTLRPRN